MHLCILSLLMIPSFERQERPFNVVMVDFSVPGDSLQKPSAPKGDGTAIRKRQPVPKSKEAAAKAVAPKRPIRKKAAPVPAREQPALSEGTAVAAPADPPGEKDSPPAQEPAGAPPAQNGPAAGTEDGGRTEGRNGGNPVAGGEDYSYIRNAVMENIRYPERARRLGIEGTVLISFVVLEDGTTSGIRVIDSSEYRLLDDSARDAVARTRITRKMPCRIAVCLPILYRLRGSGIDGT